MNITALRSYWLSNGELTRRSQNDKGNETLKYYRQVRLAKCYDVNRSFSNFDGRPKAINGNLTEVVSNHSRLKKSSKLLDNNQMEISFPK